MVLSETALLAITIALVEFVHGALLFVLIPTILTERFNWGYGTTGAAVSAYFFTEVALKLLAGWLVDRVGTRRMLLGGLWLYAAAFAGLIYARTTWEAFLALALMGAGASPLWPAALTRLTQDAGANVGGALGRVFSTWFFGGGVGIALATLVSRMAYTVSLRPFVYPLLIAAVLGLFLPVKTPERGTVARPSIDARKLAALILGSLAKLAGSLIPQIIAAGVLIPIVIPYLEFVRGLDERELFLLLLVGPGTALVLLGPAGRMGDRLGRRRTYGISLGAVALLLMALPLCKTLWTLTLDFIGIGIGYAFVFPAWTSILLRILPEDVRGAGLGMTMTIEGMGGVLGPLMGGLLWEWTNPSSPFYLSGGLLLLAAGASARWRTEAVEG